MRKRKVILAGVLSATLSLSMMAPVAAMPSDIREGIEHDEEEAEDGELVDDSDLIKLIGEDYVAVGAGNVRDYPNGNVIDVLTPGQTYYVVGERTDCNWYQISGYASNAYVYTTFLTPEDDYTASVTGGGTDSDDDGVLDNTPIDLMMTSTAQVNVRDYPNGNIVGVLDAGRDVHVIGNVDNCSWYMCDYDGETVYIYDDYLVPDFPQTMAATHNVNVRQSPRVNSPVIGSLAVGEKVKVSDMENGWYKFTYDDTGDVGYSYGDYLAAVQ